MAVTVYVPARRSGTVYVPEVSVVVVYAIPVPSFLTVIRVPGTAAPDESVTFPTIRLLISWPYVAIAAAMHTSAKMETQILLILITQPP
jgi:hypothetical protein